MRFCCLGSGSGGNAFVVEHGTTTLLVDCGFAFANIVRRMKKRFLHFTDINAVLISHEHRDHATGLDKLPQTAGLEIYMTSGTARAVGNGCDWRRIQPGASFIIGDLQITSLTVPHDANEPVQFIFDDGARRLGIFIDIGHITPAIRDACCGLDAIVIECNYAAAMLAANTFYPMRVKKRIIGKYGHLENNEAAAFIADINHRRLRHVVAAHLSANNNTEELVRKALAAVCQNDKIIIADQANGADWLTLAN